jgi:hypothetical protein
MKRKHLLWLLAITLIVTAAITIKTPTTNAQLKATLSVSPLTIDTRNLKQIGDTFSINITIANVQKLWGYQFSLFYNTTIINATNFGADPLSPDHDPLDNRFKILNPSEIGIDYVAVGRGTYNGDPTGITTVAPISVERIDFIVTGNGTTTLNIDPDYVELATVKGEKITSQIVNGKFSNTEILEIHDVAVTQASVSKTTASPGDTITINTVVANQGGFNENVTVVAKRNQTQIGNSQTVTNLANGTSSNQLTFTWDTTGLSAGIYVVTVEATINVDNNIANNVLQAGIVTIGGGAGGGIPPEIIYVAAGIAIIIIVIIVVYALRARKPK